MRLILILTAVFVLTAAPARADEPVRYYLEDGKVIAKKIADLEKRVEALEAKCAKSASPKSGECANCPHCESCPHCSRKAAPAAADVAAGALVTLSGRKLLPNGDGTYRYADPEPACAGGSCPSYVPQSLPAYQFPAQSCPGGKCPLPR